MNILCTAFLLNNPFLNDNCLGMSELNGDDIENKATFQINDYIDIFFTCENGCC